MRMIPNRRHTGMALALGAALALAACGDDATGIQDPGDQVASVRIMLGNAPFVDTVTISATGAITNDGPRISDAPTPLVAEFLDADGSVLQLSINQFQLEVESRQTDELTVTRSGSFSMVLTPQTADDSAFLDVSLDHDSEGHLDFGPFGFLVRW